MGTKQSWRYLCTRFEDQGSNTDAPGLATGQGVPSMPATRPRRLPGATHRDPPFRHCRSANKNKVVFADVLVHSEYTWDTYAVRPQRQCHTLYRNLKIFIVKRFIFRISANSMQAIESIIYSPKSIQEKQMTN
ncbi:hypothetical protein Y032_0009g435 [Ancylostoma ceylanicum]|uniref:Uncharacterized protein n=1 Tax=Ancylostoma ceylanicum TaxID=53326 RepID=A0A016VJJ9_9BILA|nr:hypothetical protein Y032_0009g435 [Ancylostoma ceylanicum]